MKTIRVVAAVIRDGERIFATARLITRLIRSEKNTYKYERA